MDSELAVKQLIKLSKYKTNKRLAGESWGKPWKTLIAISLSARTLDSTTIRVSEILFKKFSTPEKLANAKLKDVMKIIKPVNYYRNKSKYIIKCCKQLKEFKGIPPKNLEKLIKLMGVGRKTANVFLSEQGVPAIGIDTHVARISFKLKWTKNKDPVKIEQDLKKLFPKSKWNSINSILVNFGQSHNRKEEDEILLKVKN